MLLAVLGLVYAEEKKIEPQVAANGVGLEPAEQRFGRYGGYGGYRGYSGYGGYRMRFGRSVQLSEEGAEQQLTASDDDQTVEEQRYRGFGGYGGRGFGGYRGGYGGYGYRRY